MEARKKQIGVEFDPELWSRLRAQAAEEKISAGRLLERLTEAYLERTEAEKAAISRRIEEAKTTLRALKSRGAPQQVEIYALAKEVISLSEALVPGIKEIAEGLLDEEDVAAEPRVGVRRERESKP